MCFQKRRYAYPIIQFIEMKVFTGYEVTGEPHVALGVNYKTNDFDILIENKANVQVSLVTAPVAFLP
jgi:hypothetical protein